MSFDAIIIWWIDAFAVFQIHCTKSIDTAVQSPYESSITHFKTKYWPVTARGAFKFKES